MSIKQSLTNIPLIKFERSDVIRVAYERTTIYSAATLSTNIVGYDVSGDDDIQYGKPYNIQLTPKTGYQALPWNTKVLMAGVDITDSVYDKSTGTISISSVTGDITIVAEAVMMSSEYEPVEYIRNITRAANNGKYNYFDPGVLATETTEIEYDCMLLDVVNYGVVFGTEGMTASPMFSLVQRQGGAGYGKAWWGNNGYGGSGVTPMWLYPTQDIRQKIRMGKGTLTLRRAGGEYATYNMASTLDTPWENPRDLHLGGCQQSANVYRATNQHIYGCKIWQDDVLIRQYIPARRKSDRFVGMYNLLDQTFLTQKTTTGNDRSSWISPYVIPTLNLTGCTMSYVSGYEGRMETTTPEIGGTFVYKISPSSGYTFTGGTTPQVLIDGIDVTPQVVTDNGDGTYNVTIANVENKPIEITAVAVEIVEVEYIESNGVHSIMTDYVPNGANIKILSKFNVIRYTNAGQWTTIMGAYSGESKSTYRICRYSNSNDRVYCSCGSSAVTGRTVNMTLNTIYEMKMTLNNITLNGISSPLFTTLGATNTGEFGVGRSALIARYYYIQIYDGDTLKLDLIPVRLGEIAGFKDNVSGNFFIPKEKWNYQDKEQSNSLLTGSENIEPMVGNTENNEEEM